MPKLDFPSKDIVYAHHLTVPYRPLEAVAEKSVGDGGLDSSLIINGDNLHALKALRREAERAPLYPLFYGGIRAATKLAIWLSTRW